jgi:hypothetical protein
MCQNRVRKAFDTGELSFNADERQVYPEEYVELALTSTDFNNRVSRATDVQTRQFISQKAYWVGYRLSA